MITLSRALRGTQKTLIRQLVDAAPPHALSLGLGQPVVDPPLALLHAAADALPRASTYTPNAGLPQLRQAIATAHNRSPDEVLVTVGAQHALYMALASTLNPGDDILVPDPGFPVYAMLARMHGANPLPYPLRPELGFDLDPEDILARLTPNTRFVVLNTPANPTGVCFSHERLSPLLHTLAQRNIPYLSDEVYASLSYNNPTPALPSALSPHGFTASSLSKSHALMGWRLGWLLAPAPIIAALIPLQQLTVTCAAAPIQHGALAAFTSKGQDAARTLRTEMAARRDFARQRLAQLTDLPEPTGDGALYLFIDVRPVLENTSLEDDIALAFALLDHGVITIPGQAFGPGGRGFLRLSFGAPISTLSTAIERLAHGLQSLTQNTP